MLAIEETLFNSAHSALIFAFNFDCQVYPRSMMSKMAGDSLGGSGKGLGGLDGAGQAGIIRAKVREVGYLGEAALIARTANRSTPCLCRSSCCSGQKVNKEWQSAMWFLAGHIQAITENRTKKDMFIALVMKYYGVKSSLVDIAEANDISRDTAGTHNAATTKAMKSIEQAAWRSIEEKLKEANLID